MVSARTVKNKKNFCWDCHKEIKIENKEIKNGKMLVYEHEKEKIVVFKCNECFSRSKELKNYQSCEVYSRIVGYLRPVQQWNLGKRVEFNQRKEYELEV